MKPRSEPLAGAAAEPSHAELEALVSRALELRDDGRADWLAQACREQPQAEAQVRAAVERADALGGLIATTAGHDPLRGQCLGGRFRLHERIGVGAMGVVYLAEDLELRRRVACKIVHHGLLPPEQALERFAREAQALAAVQHSSVVTIHDRGRTADGQVYIVMELVDGPPLAAILEAARERVGAARGDDCAWIEAEFGCATRGETSYVRSAVRWVADLALGLEAVHRAGVLHRDIKPSNILVRRDGRPVLLDFGIALLDAQGHGTRTGTSVGTPAYMPPEALRRATDPQSARTSASDVYGLAATLYHLLTLHAPYEGTPTQVLAALATREPVAAAAHRPGLPRDLQAVLEQGMRRNPARRYPSAAAFEADLRAFLEFRPVSARPVTALERGLRRLARSRAALGALAVALLVLVAAGANAWREHALDVRRARHAELARQFPPNFTVLGRANREVLAASDRAALGALLDAAAEVAVEPLPTFLLRASFRQDHGDPDGAARDMQEVARYVDTPFARELAARYAAADRAQRGSGALDLARLPAPDSTADRYLLGYHRLRAEQIPEARELFGAPDVRAIPHADELYLAITDLDSLRGAQQQQRAVQRYADLVRLESRIGLRSATTAQLIGRMLAIQDKHADALRVYAEGIALAPRAYTLRINAAHSALVLGRLGEARAELELARELRPNYAKIAQNLVWLDIAEGHFEAAALRVRTTAPQLVPRSDEWPEYWSGVVATYAGLDAFAAGDRAECARQLEVACAHFDVAPGLVNQSGEAAASTAARIARSFDGKDVGALFLELLALLADEPHSWWRQRLVLRHMPSDLDAAATAAMRRVVEALDMRTLAEPVR
ncbi:MAG: serine/threonine-protein kinase [Planctomycetota bacterium]|nr:MAG: serine/threonine-protein kinase [Planctomycetota bacterium]